jgi:hypothetical protein
VFESVSITKWIPINGKQLKIEMWEVLFSAENGCADGRGESSRQNEPLNCSISKIVSR